MIMRHLNIALLVIICYATIFGFCSTLLAQSKSSQIKGILNNFVSYKYSDIYIYRVKQETVNDLKNINITDAKFPKWNKFIPKEQLESTKEIEKFKKLLSDSLKVFLSKADTIDETINKTVETNSGSYAKDFKKLFKDRNYSKLLSVIIKDKYRPESSSDEDDTDEESNSGEPIPIESEEEKENESEKFAKDYSTAYKLAADFIENKGKFPASAYIITDRNENVSEANIIALITINNSFFLKKYVDNFEDIAEKANQNELKLLLESEIGIEDKTILTIKELKAFSLNSVKLDKKLLEIIDQKGAENITAFAQGISEGKINFLPKKFGVSKPVSEDSIQQYLRITDGQPFDYQNEHELTIGLFDVIRYRYFKEQKSLLTDEVDETGNPVSPQKKVNNQFLPVFGIELKYGLNEINYPSLWSERMTLNVMWQSNKLGVILPTNGWSQLSKDFFNIERRLTNAGIGLYGSFDLPIKLINQGGVFNFNGSYVFGDAKANPINSIMMIPGRTFEGKDSAYSTSLNLSYLPRFHAQAHYSFAINVDKYTFFRFKLGATAFLMQRYADLDKNVGTDSQSGRAIIEKANRKIDQYTYADLNDLNRFDNNQIIAMSSIQASELIAGLSGRIEFMTNTEEQTVPWGGALQYFDGALSGDLWLQVPILGFDRVSTNLKTDENQTDDQTTTQMGNDFALSLRAQAQFFQTVFRDPRPWEMQTIAIPSLQLLFNF